jgi:DNA processing protein
MTILNFEDNNFPRLLKEIPKPPQKIFYKGELPKEKEICIAIVGTRRATSAGLEIARKFGKGLAASGITVVSGLAMGIDTAAHKGSLEARGKTIAVLGNGLNEVYPQQNEKLADEIIETGGALISEYEPDTPSYKDNFLQRNRIVSGLSLGVVVIEAPERSGSLNTATHALEQNREVFVVPGPLNNPNYAGSHALLRAGARLVTKPEDILEDLNLDHQKSGEQKLLLDRPGLNDQERIIIGALNEAGNPLTIDKMGELLKIDVSAISRVLTMLLIKGMVKEEGGLYRISN